jgi:hypothetical protein
MFGSVRSVVIGVCLAALAGACRDKPKRQDPPANVETPSTVGSGGSGMHATPNLVLPAGPGSPPVHTTKPLARGDFERLQKLSYAGFQLRPHGLGDKLVEVRQLTVDFPKLLATITIETCEKPAIIECAPIDLDKWKGNPKLKNILLPELRDKPDTEWEVGKTSLLGQDMIFTYQFAPYSMANGHGASADAYALYWNDGVNSIRVVAQYADDPVDGPTMKKMAPKSDLERVAKAFMDVYTHEWTPG